MGRKAPRMPLDKIGTTKEGTDGGRVELGFCLEYEMILRSLWGAQKCITGDSLYRVLVEG